VGEGGDKLKKKQVLTMMSIAVVSFLFGTTFSFTATVTGDSGSPWDNVWTTISELQSQVETLTDQVETLEEQLQPQGFMTAPSYDSGWVSAFDPGSIYHTFEHGLNTTNVLVSVVSNDDDLGINQVWYWSEGGRMRWFNLTKNNILLEIHGSVPSDEIRVMIWKISEPPT